MKKSRENVDKAHFSEYIMSIMPKPKSGEFSRSLVVLIESRLRDLRLSIHAAEKHYGFPPETLRSVIRGSAPSVDRAKQICDALGIAIAFSLTPHNSVSGSEVGSDGHGRGVVMGRKDVDYKNVDYRAGRHQVCESHDFPIVGIVRAGAEIEYWNDQFPGGDTVSMPGEIFNEGGGSRWGGVVVRGDSMSPIFDDSDILFFDLSFDGAKSELLGKACVVETAAGGAMVKRVERGRRAGYYNLESYNRNHPVVVDVALRTARPVLWVKKG